MAKYKPVKIMFDIEDSYQLKLYEYLKQRTNGSSYIRTLLHQDMNSVAQSQTVTEPEPEPQIISYQDKIGNGPPQTDEVKNVMKEASVHSVDHHNGIKLSINEKPIEIVEEDIFVDDLI